MSRPTHEPKHLLDTLADQNIGNGVVIQPQLTGATVIPQTNPERILMLSGPSSAGQTTTIAITASRIVGSENPNPGYPGPITAVIEFGNGGQFTTAEVDVPPGPYLGYTTHAAPSTEPKDGGVIVTVPTGVLRVYARYDNALIQPQINTAGISIAQQNGVKFVGPGGPVQLVDTHGNPYTIPAEPVRVKAMAAYYTRRSAKAYRTQYLYVTDQSSGVKVPISGFSSAFCVPPFAKALKVLRSPVTAGFDLFFFDSVNHELDSVGVPSGSAPIIPLQGTESLVVISVNNPITLLAFSYEIGI